MGKVEEFFRGYGRTCFYNAKEVADRMGISVEEAEKGIQKLVELGAIYQSGTWNDMPAYRPTRGYLWKVEI